MFIAALFTIAKLWKPLKCPSADEWIGKRWCVCKHTHTHTHTHVHIHIVEYYSALKKNEILSLTATRMHLGMIILSEVNQTKTSTI